MAKRIIIIDNRQERARTLMKEEWDRLLSLPNLSYVDRIDGQDLSTFDVIGIHGTYVNEKKLSDYLHSFMKDKFVIVFSGGISQVNLLENGHLLKIPAVLFYSSRLIPFCSFLQNTLSDEGIELSMLVYGVDHWKIPQLLKLRELLCWYPDEDRRLRRIENQISQLMASLSITDINLINSIIDKELRAL